MSIMDLTDARALKRTDLPLDTPVVHREFSREFGKHWCGLVYAQIRLLNAIFGYANKYGPKTSIHKRRLIDRRLDDMTRAIHRCDLFVAKRGNVNRSDQNRHERDILASFLMKRAVPFVEFWPEAIKALYDGVALEIKPKDIPIWLDEVPG
jgi:hypothetical protein